MSHIKLGSIFKNYKHLCETLGVEVKAGNSRKSQLKDFERYFKYGKDGHKYIITHIYNVPLPKNNNKTKYISTIEKLILDKMVCDYNVKDGTLFISKSKLLKELQMINYNYLHAKYKQLRLSKYMNITIEEIEEFYLTSDDLLKRNIEAALNNLHSQSLIYWSHVQTVCKVVSNVEVNKNNQYKLNKEYTYDEFGEQEENFSVNTISKREYRKATKEEVKEILRIERLILKELRCENKHEVFKRNLSNKFYKKVNDILFELYNILFYYNSYEITFNEANVIERWRYLENLELKEIEREEAKNNLNDDVMERLKGNAKSRHNRAIDNYFLGDDSSKIERRIKDSYISNNEKLVDTLIHRDADPIEYQLKYLNNNN